VRSRSKLELRKKHVRGASSPSEKISRVIIGLSSVHSSHEISTILCLGHTRQHAVRTHSRHCPAIELRQIWTASKVETIPELFMRPKLRMLGHQDDSEAPIRNTRVLARSVPFALSSSLKVLWFSAMT
jgi:hypothetical protein